MTRVYLGVGSNIEPNKHIQAAYIEMSQLGSLKMSPVYQCDPVHFIGEPFLNLVIELETDLSLEALHRRLKTIEFKWGRKQDVYQNKGHTLDIDILLYGDITSSYPVQIPRQDIFKYEFVLRPLFELNPHLYLPGEDSTSQENSVAQLWAEYTPKGSLKLIPFSWGRC